MPAQAINWAAWSHVVEAAQDPNQRDAVQKFLAAAELSGEIPAALDEKVLAHRRSAGATGEQCAYVLCNLGFAALAAIGSKGSAAFAIACGRLVEQLAPGSPDLALRRHFLSTKASLLAAALTDQPHLLWGSLAGQCTAYLRALVNEETLPAEAIESNATAAYSFSGQFLSRLLKLGAVKYYAREVSQLIEVALELASRLPPAFVSRMWSSLMPGTDAGVFFRQIGAAAECFLQIDDQPSDHAARGLGYIDEILAQAAVQPAPDIERIRRLRAELLLLAGRHADAAAQADALESSSDPALRENAIAIKARCHLVTGNPQLAAGILAGVAPTVEQALGRWRATWMGDGSDRYWTAKPDPFAPPEGDQFTWRLQAAAAADAADMPELLGAANRATGFLADSFFQHRQKWMVRPSKANRGRTADRVAPGIENKVGAAIPDADPLLALDEILGQLVNGTALLQVINTGAGIVTWVARKRDGEVSVIVAPDRPNANKLIEAHKSWSHAYFNTLRHRAGTPQNETDGAIVFSRLLDEVSQNWGNLLQGLIEDGVTQLILIGDDLVDLPLHAMPTGSGNERLIDRIPVTYVPSLYALGACIDRPPADQSRRRGVTLRSLIDSELDAADATAGAMAATLETDPCKLAPADASFWTDAASAEVLHIVAHASHNARVPFDSVLGAGSLDLKLAELVAGLDLPHCEIVANVHCESALPSTLRAPGLDLSAVLLAAGARSVLASTWVVRDDLAAELTQSFFRHWVSGCAPAAAFQQALRSLRAGQPTLPDFQWAGMRLVGAP